jgi:cysteine desulfurase
MDVRAAEHPTAPTVVYLDYNATAPLRPEALAAMLPVLRSVGNAASPHAFGHDAAARVEAARRQLADLLGCSAGELVFTSGATEANNLALRSALAHGGRLVVSAVEHPAVLETARALTRAHPKRLVVLPVDEDGLLDLTRLRHAARSGGVALVSVMAANNDPDGRLRVDAVRQELGGRL